MARTARTIPGTKLGRNLTVELDDDNILTLRVDLNAPTAPSKSGKSLVVASSKGLVQTLGDVKVNLNVTRELDE